MKKHYANMISWGSFIISILIFLLIFNNKLSINYALLAVVIAAFLDTFDGKIARIFITDEKDFLFGEITDSLCDTINFGVFPIVTFLYLFSENIFITFIVSSFYLWSAIFRLARFSRNKTKLKVDYYSGMPVTVAGPLAILFVLIFKDNLFLSSLTLLILGIFMVSNIKIKKL